MIKFGSVLLPLAVIAACARSGTVEVKDAWTRDTIGSTANAAIFMTINAPAGDRLIKASSPAAKRTDLMTMQSGSGAMQMTYVKDIAIPPNAPVSLNAGGLHVWLEGLNQPLQAGETIPLVLSFEKAGDRRIEVPVIGPAAVPPGSASES